MPTSCSRRQAVAARRSTSYAKLCEGRDELARQVNERILNGPNTSYRGTPMITLEQSANRAIRHLNDDAGQVWSRDNVKRWIQNGYDKLVRTTECLFDMAMFSSEPVTANHTRKFEEAYMTGSSFRSLGSSSSHASPKGTWLAQRSGPVGSPPSRRERWLRRTSFGAHHWRIAQRVHQHRPSEPTPGCRFIRERPYSLRNTRRIYETQQGGVFSYTVNQEGSSPCARSACPVPLTPTVQSSGRFWCPAPRGHHRSRYACRRHHWQLGVLARGRSTSQAESMGHAGRLIVETRTPASNSSGSGRA